MIDVIFRALSRANSDASARANESEIAPENKERILGRRRGGVLRPDASTGPVGLAEVCIGVSLRRREFGLLRNGPVPAPPGPQAGHRGRRRRRHRIAGGRPARYGHRGPGRATRVPRPVCTGFAVRPVFQPVSVALPYLMLIALISDAIKIAFDINARIVMPDNQTAGEGEPGKFHASFPGPGSSRGRTSRSGRPRKASAGGREFEDIMLRRSGRGRAPVPRRGRGPRVHPRPVPDCAGCPA